MSYTSGRLLWLLLLLGTRLLPAQQDSSYWQTYIRPLDLQGDSLPAGLALLDSTVQHYRFFFTAEQHWKTVNTRIQLAFLKYLYEKAGVRNLIVEGGYSYGYLIDRYLETGDKRLLRKVLTNIPVCPDDQMAMFEALYAFNQSLPPGERIQVSGIDLEHAPELSIQALYTMMPEGEASPPVQRMMNQVRDLHESPYFDKRETRQYFRRLNRDLIAREADYRAFWGEDYELVLSMSENVLQGMDFSLIKAVIFKRQWQTREEQMFRNFVLLAPRLRPGNYYAQFGALHTDIERSYTWDFPSLAHRLNYFGESPVANQVLTISRYLRPMDQHYTELRDYEALRGLVRHVEQAFPQQIVLASLIGKNSPFDQLRENFQFILLIDPEVEAESCD
ncbi:MAG: hypothetical protein OHK0039_35710 [Bacteroidia bacterium]